MKSSFDLSTIKPYAAPLLAVVAIGIFLPLVIMPGYSTLQDNLTERQEKKDELQSLQNKVASLKALNKQELLTLLADDLEPAIPSTADPSGLLGQVERTAQEAGAKAQAASYTYEKPLAPPVDIDGSQAAAADSDVAMEPEYINASVSISGTFAQLKKFMTHLEVSRRLTSISNLNINLDMSDTSKKNLLMSIDVETPFIRDLENLGAATLPLPDADASPANPLIQKLRKMDKTNFSSINPDSIKGRSNPF